MSKSAATSAWLRSPRRATRTTSRLNSGGNFLGTATSFLRDPVPQNRCQPEVQQSRRGSMAGSDDNRGAYEDRQTADSACTNVIDSTASSGPGGSTSTRAVSTVGADDLVGT